MEVVGHFKVEVKVDAAWSMGKGLGYPQRQEQSILDAPGGLNVSMKSFGVHRY